MRMTSGNGLLLAVMALAGCGPTTSDAAAPTPPTLTATQGGGPGASGPAAAPSPAPTPAAGTLEERHVSTSPGVVGGVTILWPRIIPRDIVDETRPLGAALQEQMKRLVSKHLPGRPIDFRPEPERVCPKTGCVGVSVGLLLSRQGQGCLVIALISKPGVSPTQIVPWVGEVALRSPTVGFREWPESQLTVIDYVPCNTLLSTMDKREPEIAAALKAAAQ